MKLFPNFTRHHLITHTYSSSSSSSYYYYNICQPRPQPLPLFPLESGTRRNDVEHLPVSRQFQGMKGIYEFI